MGVRRYLSEAMDAAIDFGRVAASALTTGKTLLATLRGDAEDADDTNAEEREVEVWGHAAILWRPAPPTTGGDSCEVVFIRRGDEMVPVASRDVRWQVDLSEGDVVLRALGSSTKPKLTLKADGTAILEADTVKIGDSGATEGIGLGTAIKGHLDALKTAYDAHTHLYNLATGPGVTGSVPTPSAAPAAASPAVPDVESRHKVEN